MMYCWEYMNCGLGPNDLKGKKNKKVCAACRYPPGICYMVAGPEAFRENQCVEIRKGKTCTECPYYAQLNVFGDPVSGPHWFSAMENWFSKKPSP